MCIVFDTIRQHNIPKILILLLSYRIKSYHYKTTLLSFIASWPSPNVVKIDSMNIVVLFENLFVVFIVLH